MATRVSDRPWIFACLATAAVASLAALGIGIWILVDVTAEMRREVREFHRMRDELSATSALLVSVNQSLSYLVQNDSNEYEVFFLQGSHSRFFYLSKNRLSLEFIEFVEYSIIGMPDHELCRRNNTCEIAFYHEYFEDDSYCTYEQVPDDTEYDFP